MLAADLYEWLPELRDILPEAVGYRWARDTSRVRFLGEIRAVQSSAGMGYPYHVELHRRQALELLRRDLEANAARQR